MRFDHKKFFDGYKPFYHAVTGKELDATKVSSLDALLTEFEQNPLWQFTNQIAYAFATMHVETFWPKSGSRYAPITEGGTKAYFNKYDGRRDLGNTQAGDGYRFRGRGFVQITGRKNYTKFSKLVGVDLVSNPDAALDFDTSFKIMTIGMFQGGFTGKKLTTYVNATQSQYKKARGVINGTDRDSEIAGYATSIELILNRAIIGKASNIAEVSDSGEVTTSTSSSTSVTTSEGTAETATTTTSTSAGTADVEGKRDYNGIGFMATIKRDLAAVTGGNLTIQSLPTLLQQFTGLPEWVGKILYIIGIVIIIASVAYLVFRVINYVMFRIADNHRVRLEAEAKTSTLKKDINWVEPGTVVPPADNT